MATLDDVVRAISALSTRLDAGGAAGAAPGALDPLDTRDPAEQIRDAEKLRDIYADLGKSHEGNYQATLQQLKIDKLSLKQKVERGELDSVSANNLRQAIRSNELLVDSMGRAADSGESLTKSFSSMVESAGKLGTGLDPKSLLNIENIKEMGANFGDLANGIDGGTVSLTNFVDNLGLALLQAYAQAIVNLAMDLADAEANFMKATGASQDLARTMTNAYNTTREFGASMEETNAMGIQLYGTVTDFTFASEEQQRAMVEVGTTLSKLGMSYGAIASSMQIATKAMGMSFEEAGQNMIDLEKFAEELGVPVSQLGDDFANNGNMLAKMGAQGDKAFRNLAIASKISGLEMSKILAITDKFDTFEGAAEMAGKLNAAIGGNMVNAMDLMMTTDPAERFSMIRDAILDTGLTFDDMSYYQKNFYAESMGLADVSELALVLAGDMDSVSGATQQSSQEIQEAADRAKEMATMQEKLSMVMHQMIPIITPIIDGFSTLLDWMTQNVQTIKIFGAILLGIGAFMAGPVAGGIAAAVLGFMLLFDAIEVGKEKTSGLSLVFEGIAEVFGYVGEALGYMFEPFEEVFGMFGDWLGGGDGKMLETIFRWIGRAVGALAVAFVALQIPLTPIIATFLLLSTVLRFIMGLFKDDTVGSTLLEVIFKFADAFMLFGEGIQAVLAPLGSFMASMAQLATSPVLELEIVKNVTGAVAGATPGVGATAGTPGGGGTSVVRQPISIELNGDKMANFVVEVIGEKVRQVNLV